MLTESAPNKYPANEEITTLIDNPILVTAFKSDTKVGDTVFAKRIRLVFALANIL